MTNHRYISIFALETLEGMIPFWEIEAYRHDDVTGDETYTYKDEEYERSLIECVYDLKKKAVKSPVIKDIYPTKLNFSVGEIVYREVKQDYMVEDRIESILYEECETSYYKSKKLLEWYRSYFTPEELSSSDFYEVRLWKPWYKMVSGEVVRYDMYLKHVYTDNTANVKFMDVLDSDVMSEFLSTSDGEKIILDSQRPDKGTKDVLDDTVND